MHDALPSHTYPSWFVTGLWISWYSFDLLRFHALRFILPSPLHYRPNIGRNPSGNEPYDNQFKRAHSRKPITFGETKLQEALHGTFSYLLIVFFFKSR